jgi:predicted DNA-binding transcriptional regulator AlpA
MGQSVLPAKLRTTADVASFAGCRFGVLLKTLKPMLANYVKKSMGVNIIRMIQMSEYEFTLTFSLPGEPWDPEYYLDALYEAGCDDALIGTGQPGTIALEFVREAVSAAAAVKSAIANVTAAIPGAELFEAKPDLVGLSDVAEILQCSRQNIRKYMVSYPEFPKPVYTGASTLWHLWELASFAKINIPRTVAELSRTTFRINLDIQQHRYQKTAAGNGRSRKRGDMAG